jgi:glycosyltransferase involved in cell wall biosynthesis
MKIAVIAEQMIFPGGGDRLLLSVLKAFPDAVVFTSVFLPKNYDTWTDFHVGSIHSSIKTKSLFGRLLQSRMFNRPAQRLLNLLSPYIYEQMDLRGFDLVLSMSARYAHSVIIPLETHFINLYLTPPRYEWDKNMQLRTLKRSGIAGLFSDWWSMSFRQWDYVAAARPDENYAISNYIARKVKKYYGIDCNVLYPPVNQAFFDTEKLARSPENEEYFLVVSRLYDYKRIEWAIKACLQTNKKLIIIGKGPDEKYLRRVAGNSMLITFLGNVTDDLMMKYYHFAQGLIFCGVEDFGLVMVEALAQGCPVIGFNEGGASEIVIAGKTGKLFNDYEELVRTIKMFDKKIYEQSAIISRAKEFSQEKFTAALQEILKNYGN